MAIAITAELRESRAWRETPSEKSLERVFHVTGTDDPAQASAFGPQIDEYWDDEMQVVERVLTPIMPAGSGPDDGVMELRVRYHWQRIQGAAEAPEFELDIGTESEHVFQTPRKHTIDGVVYPALDQAHYGGNDRRAEPKNFINMNEEKVAEGVDVLVPMIQKRENNERSSLPVAYQQTLIRMVGKVNKNAWRGWSAKAVLFLGVTARRRRGENWRVSYSFLIGYHTKIEMKTADGADQTITKSAHDYIWFRRTKKEAEGVAVESDVLDVHVAPLYHEADFAELGIGTEALS